MLLPDLLECNLPSLHEPTRVVEPRMTHDNVIWSLFYFIVVTVVTHCMMLYG